ncbi:guanylate kinase [Micromonospora nigra]|uniref:Guanylate kinase n=1 Tax=Micromonospora nigra TaxID=145857 RepID=A0A1C6RHS4_9ACTN|nr:kinase [Micromonospora nigra]SCL16736.1 guanylate kinase [Micromonospora nigra]
MRGVILYGPPASGKDTVTAGLHRLDNRYQQFQRLKVGSGRTTGYRMTTAPELAALRAAGEVVWENRRYGAVYVVDDHGLRRQLHDGIPVVHLGQVDAVDAVREAFPDAQWTVVALTCPRDVAAARIAQRQTGDTAERLQAWDQTEAIGAADLTIDTSETCPDRAAKLIDQAVRGSLTAPE